MPDASDPPHPARPDPDYVEALGETDNAEWGRRAAMLAFFVPSVSLGLDETSISLGGQLGGPERDPVAEARQQSRRSVVGRERVRVIARLLERGGAAQLGQA